MYAPEARTSTVSNPLDSAQWFRETKQLKNIRTSTGVLEVWFHGPITRTQAEELLKGRAVGSFLIRVSQTRFGYSLSFKGKTRCYHIAIEQRGSLYIVIGDNRASFRSLRDLIIFYKRHPVVEEGYVLTEAVGQEEDGCDYLDLVDGMTDITLTPTIDERPPSIEVASDAIRTPTPIIGTAAPITTTPASVVTTPAPITTPASTTTTTVPAARVPASTTTTKGTPTSAITTPTQIYIGDAWEEPVRQPTDKREIISWFRRTQMSPLMKKQGGFYPWFYGIVSKSKAELMLKDKNAGCYFVRVCDDQCMLCLSMKGSRGKVKHFDIACLPNKKYQVVGELKDFRSMNNLIQYYKMYPISAFGDKLNEVGCREGHVIDFTELLQGAEDKNGKS